MAKKTTVDFQWANLLLRSECGSTDNLTLNIYRDILNEEYGADIVYHALSRTELPDDVVNVRAEMRLLDTILYNYPLFNLYQ